MTIRTLQCKMGCLVANNNRIAREILKIKHTQVARANILLGSSEKAPSNSLPPSAKPDTVSILREISGARKGTRDNWLRTFNWEPYTKLPNIRSMKIEGGD